MRFATRTVVGAGAAERRPPTVDSTRRVTKARDLTPSPKESDPSSVRARMVARIVTSARSADQERGAAPAKRTRDCGPRACAQRSRPPRGSHADRARETSERTESMRLATLFGELDARREQQGCHDDAERDERAFAPVALGQVRLLRCLDELESYALHR